MRILITDDHALVRQGVRRILQEAFPRATIGEAQNATEALEQVWNHCWDVVLLDMTMPGRNGLDVLKQIRQCRPAPSVLMLSAHPESQYAVRALKSGAAGYLTKQAAGEELIAAIRQVIAGGRYVTATLAHKLAGLLERGLEQPEHASLTNREDEVLRLLAAGRTVGEIAQSLALSVKTISTHRTHILEKLQLRNNAELMRYALQHNLVPV